MTLSGEHEYDIEVTETENGQKFELYYSMCGEWTKPGTLVMSLFERAKDSSVDLPKLGKTIDVSVMNELSLMLRFILLHDSEEYTDELHYNIVPSVGIQV